MELTGSTGSFQCCLVAGLVLQGLGGHKCLNYGEQKLSLGEEFAVQGGSLVIAAKLASATRAEESTSM